MVSPEAYFDILAREPVTGGQASLRKERLRVPGAELLLKRTGPAEVVALRAAQRVPEASAVPRLVGSGRDGDGDWIALPFYGNGPAADETDLPDNVVDSLAAVHAFFLDSGAPAEIPVRDADWWVAACAQHRLGELDRAVLRPVVDTVRSWSTRRSIRTALDELPRTLLHGDVHRNNVVFDGPIGRLVDWGGAAYGIPAFDLVTPGPPGSPAYERYAARWEALTGQSAAEPAWRRGYLAATAGTKISYLSFAARNFGDAAALRMFETAADALRELERL
ncbi:MAG TPA: aminoglycoside phosphotransferase family protein [Mycobacteriales bacterium]|nr:aminoglycoside phosphotransferase family protein [Mycobacteriales bacterium]